MTADEMEAIVMSFPGVEKGMSYGSPAYKLNGKFFTRLRRDDQSMVLMEVSLDEREMLWRPSPHLPFHRPLPGYPCVWRASPTCIRARSRTSSTAASEDRQKTAVKAYDAAQGGYLGAASAGNSSLAGS